MTGMIPSNADFAAVVRSSFGRQGLMTLYGARLVRVDPGSVEIEVPFRAELSQQQGLFHGGVTAAVADTACGYAALTLMPAGSEVLTINFGINLLAAADGDRLLARGRVVRSGRTITVCQGDAYAVAADAQEVHCATLTATMLRVEVPS